MDWHEFKKKVIKNWCDTHTKECVMGDCPFSFEGCDTLEELDKIDLLFIKILTSVEGDSRREVLQVFCGCNYVDECNECKLYPNCIGFATANEEDLSKVYGELLKLVKKYCISASNVTHEIDEIIKEADKLPAPVDNGFEEPDKTSEDFVNHPNHYATGKFECIDVMQEVFGVEAVMHFCLCNAFKYLYRCFNKFDSVEDIQKAKWYIDKYLEIREEL